MSTDTPTRRGRTRSRRTRAFAGAFAAVLAGLAVLGLAGAAAGVAHGPRVSGVQVDPAAAAAASGARLIVTTTQSLGDVDPTQVTVTPDTPFAVDTSGRAIGVRFGMPLRDDTEYTVTIRGVAGLGGGPEVDIAQTFRTPKAEVYLLQRGDEEDTIFRTDLTGEQAVPIFRHAHIEDFRATSAHLVASVRTDDDRAALIVTDRDGGGERELPLPGEGTIAALQSADRGELIGYTFTDLDLDAPGARESMLFTASLNDQAADEPPAPVELTGADSSVAQWQFVPDSDSILLVSFDGSLLLTDGSGDDPTVFGTAITLDGIAGTDAIVERVDGMVVLDLTDGTEEPLPGIDPDGDLLGRVLPVPGGGTLRTMSEVDAEGLPERQRVDFVSDDGAAEPVFAVDPADALLQVCVSPSGRYAAMLVAPDIVDNPYDGYQLPMPAVLETHVVELDDATEVVALAGFDISWCRVPPE
jgi:hypothetical protein